MSCLLVLFIGAVNRFGLPSRVENISMLEQRGDGRRMVMEEETRLSLTLLHSFAFLITSPVSFMQLSLLCLLH